MAARILIVDDNPDILLLLRTNLRACGFETETAADGEEALRAIEKRSPDVVLLDLMMPVLDGWGVLEALRERTGAPPVVVVSAAASEANEERARSLGAAGYVTKPFAVADLVDRIRAVLGPRAPAGTDAVRPSN
jgi:DNA-binding response OmpR family regulator